MTSPFDDLQNYRPGAQGLRSLAVSTASVSTSTLSDEYFYQVIATCDVWFAVKASAVTVTSTAGEFLPSYDWSPPFRAHESDKVYALRAGSSSGRLYLRRLGQ